jgi:carbon starvation protein
MNILVPVVAAAAFLLIALRIYPRWIASVFNEDDSNPTPAVRNEDGRDYIKSRTAVVFGHHFATIAGAGPIVGPTLAIAFGWQPVWLWVVLGGIFYGAVHDMSVMFASVREGGKTIAEVARRTLGPLGYLLMLLVLVFVLSIINAIFLKLSVQALTSAYPLESLRLDADQTLLKTYEEPVYDNAGDLAGTQTHGRIGGIATTSVIIITIFAPLLGWLIRRKRLKTSLAYLIAGGVCVLSVIVGFQYPVVFKGSTWAIVMSCYVFVACAIPVWVVLQPRDFTNVQLLYGGLALLFVSAIVAGIGGRVMDTPSFDLETGSLARDGPIWPVLFITVACGAISGFHSIVSSGTTSKQITRESDCRRIGYGAMILESFFAVLVLVAVASFPRQEYLQVVYPQIVDATTSAKGNWILGFALGAGSLIEAALPFIPLAVATVLGILMIEGFVVTTLDTSVRLCRYMIDEFWNFVFDGKAPWLCRQPLFNAAVAVGLMVWFYLSATINKMWNVFGAGNQLMGALALTTVSVWLVQRARKHLFAAVPAAFMLATTIGYLCVDVVRNFKSGGNQFLGGASAALLLLSVGVVAVGTYRFAKAIQENARERAARTS